MATIKLRVRGKRNPSPIYLRFVNGRNLDIEVKLNLFVDPSVWDKKHDKIRNVITVKNRDVLNKKLSNLKTHILSSYNEAFMYGEIIDNQWLESTANSFFMRPKHEEKMAIKPEFVYLYDYGHWWLENKASSWKSKKYKSMPPRQVKNYLSALSKLNDFQGKKKIKLSDVSTDIMYQFIDFLENENYGSATIRKFITQIRFFVNRAKADDLKNVGDLDGRVYVSDDTDKDIIVPYLNEEEIEDIMNLDLSNNDTLDSVRDSFIISLWTGLRISDFNNKLDITNIDGDFISIENEKTGAWVEIPLHPHVKKVLNKRIGALPRRIADSEFNRLIKDVVKLAGIKELTKGRLFNTEVKRKETGLYPKYKLISAHTGRRSFATNLYGLVPNHVIMAVGGWKKEDMMLHYIKKTRREHSSILKQKWDEKYRKINESINQNL